MSRKKWLPVILGISLINDLLGSNRAMAWSPEIDKAVQTYKGGSPEVAKPMFESLIDNKDNPNESQVALFYLAIIATAVKGTGVDNYLCQLLSLETSFDPGRYPQLKEDVPKELGQKWVQLKQQNLCLPLSQYQTEISKTLQDKNCNRAEALVLKWEQRLPKSSPELKTVKEWRDRVKNLTLVGTCSKTPPSLPSPVADPGMVVLSSPTSDCGVISFRVEELLKTCQQWFEKGFIITDNKNNNKDTALTCGQQAQKLCPNHDSVISLFKKMESFYRQRVEKALQNKQPDKAKKALEGLKTVNPQSPVILELERQLSQ